MDRANSSTTGGKCVCKFDRGIHKEGASILKLTLFVLLPRLDAGQVFEEAVKFLRGEMEAVAVSGIELVSESVIGQPKRLGSS